MSDQDIPDNALIRIARRGDLRELCCLLHACVDHMRCEGIDQWDDLYPNMPTLETDVENGSLYLLERAGKRIHGAVALDAHQAPEYQTVAWRIPGDPVAVVHRLMVHPGAQGRGFARLLMRFVEERARYLGFSVIRLDAFSGNPRALSLYSGLGYREAGTVSFRKGRFHCFEKAL